MNCRLNKHFKRKKCVDGKIFVKGIYAQELKKRGINYRSFNDNGTWQFLITIKDALKLKNIMNKYDLENTLPKYSNEKIGVKQ